MEKQTYTDTVITYSKSFNLETIEVVKPKSDHRIEIIEVKPINHSTAAYPNSIRNIEYVVTYLWEIIYIKK